MSLNVHEAQLLRVMQKEGALNSDVLLVVAKINICVQPVIIQLPQHVVCTLQRNVLLTSCSSGFLRTN